MRLLTIIPTYNEIDNIEDIIHTVFKYVPQDAGILIVDDNSPDGTASEAEKIAENYPDRLYVKNRLEKQGVASAFLHGFKWGIDNNFDILLAMDADFSHNPEYIPNMIKEIKNADLVIGSRNVKGGRIENRTLVRNILTKGGSFYCQTILKCPIKDITGGFNMWRKTTLLKIGLENVVCGGYSFQIEMKYKTFINGLRITEIPIIFPDRKKGLSKMSGHFLIKALWDVWRIRNIFNPNLAEFIKFAVTGGLGTITNLTIFFILVDLNGFHEIPVSIGCFLIAATQNYFINHFWSFNKTTAHTKPSLKKWITFIFGSLIGLTINIFVMTTLLVYLNLPYKAIAQGIGIAAGMIVNFIISKYLIFKKRDNK